MDIDKDDKFIEPARGRPNKSQLKRETQAIRKLVRQLVSLPNGTLDGLTLDEKIREAVTDARKMEKSALRRQLIYITGLIRHIDTDELEKKLNELDNAHKAKVNTFHEIEQWRDGLISGDEALLNQLVERYSVNRQYLRQLVRNARKEKKLDKPPKSARILFKVLKELAQNE